MIVSFILSGANVTPTASPHWVANNPVDWRASYCLPLAVVTYGPRYPMPFPFKVAMTVPIWDDARGAAAAPAPVVATAWCSPFRWHWQQDGGALEPYTDAINGVIERQFELYARGAAPARFTTHPIVRYVNDAPQTYHIDFQANQQIHSGVILMHRASPCACAF